MAMWIRLERGARLEDLDRLAFAEGHHRALPGLRVAADPAAADRLAALGQRVDAHDLDVEQLLDRAADLDLVRVERNAEVVGVAATGVVGRLLAEHRLLDDAVETI